MGGLGRVGGLDCELYHVDFFIGSFECSMVETTS
jgi:hypothetical protein